MTDIAVCSKTKTEKNILNKTCLKEKLVEWIESKSEIYELMQESRISIEEIIVNWEHFNFSENKLLLLIANLVHPRNNFRLKNIDSAAIIKSLNKCAFNDLVKYEFNEFGYLFEIEQAETISDKGIYQIIGDLHSELRTQTRFGLENGERNDTVYSMCILSVIISMVSKIKKFLKAKKGDSFILDSTNKTLTDLEIVLKLFDTSVGNIFDGNDRTSDEGIKLESEFKRLMDKYRNDLAHNPISFSRIDFISIMTHISILFKELDRVKDSKGKKLLEY